MFRTLICLFPLFIFSLPKGEKIIHGNVSIHNETMQAIVEQNSPKAILHWEDFSVGQQERVLFEQPSSESVILNRVTGFFPSKIDGLIQGNGHVYLINQNGVVIGPKGEIKTKGFVASTLNLTDEAFLEQKEMHYQGKKNSKIFHLGNIQADQIFLISSDIESEGNCQGNFVGFAAGEEVYLTKDLDKIWIHPKGNGVINHKGVIKSVESQLKSAGGNLYNLALNQEGVIEAKGVCRKKGRIILSSEKGITSIDGSQIASSHCTGGYIEVTGDALLLNEKAFIDASGDYEGGEVLLGGDYRGQNPDIKNAKVLLVDDDAKIYADAKIKGDGGKVIFWSDNKTHFLGSVYARGGEEGGDGGFVEISSHKELHAYGHQDTSAPFGEAGTVLYDPSDITIDDFGGVSDPLFPTTVPGTYDPTTATAQLDVADITTTLALNNVSIVTESGSTGSGIVNVNADISWATTTKLTITADRQINFNNVTISNTASLLGNFLAMDFKANQGVTPITGNFFAVNLFNSTLTSIDGNINLQGVGGTVGSNSGIILDNSTVSSTGNGADSATITLNGTGGAGTIDNVGVILDGGTISSQDGNISVTGSSNATGSFNYGIELTNQSLIDSLGSGSGSATITLNGTAGGTTDENVGLVINDQSIVRSQDGNVIITALGAGDGTNNYGMQMNNSTIQSIGTGQDAATITITNATSGNGQSSAHGILQEGSTITTVDGDLNITATSQGTGDFNNGIKLQAGTTISSTGTTADAADITITTTGGGGTEDVFGLHGDSVSNVTTEAGDLTVTGGFLLDPE